MRSSLLDFCSTKKTESVDDNVMLLVMIMI
jgi:hypothetical protein